MTNDLPPEGGGRALTLAFLAATIVGFDRPSAGVAAPKLAPAFALTPAELGLFFSGRSFARRRSGFSRSHGGRGADRAGSDRGSLLDRLHCAGRPPIVSAATSRPSQTSRS